MIFSQLFSLKNIKENKRKGEGKRGRKFYGAHGIRILVLSSDQVGLIGSRGKQGATLTDLGWVLASLATVGQGPSNATASVLPYRRHWQSSLSAPVGKTSTT